MTCDVVFTRQPRSRVSRLPTLYTTPQTTHHHTNMNSAQEDTSAPSIRFKRRKIAHPKRTTHLEDDTPTIPTSQSPDAVKPTDAARSPPPTHNLPEDPDSVPNLKEILRNRKRPRDRLRDAARKSDTPRTELVQIDAPRPDQYTSRFVAQTGQVVDRDDKQM